MRIYDNAKAPPTPSVMPLYILFTKWFIKDGISNGMDNTISYAYKILKRKFFIFSKRIICMILVRKQFII